MELNVPPLRERPEDILPLASAFIAEFTRGQRAVFVFGRGLPDALPLARKRA